MESFAPLRKIRRKGRPPWQTAKVDKAFKTKTRAWKNYCENRNHKKYLMYLKSRNAALKTQKAATIKYETRLANNAKKNPKAFYNYVQSKATLREAVGSLKDSQGVEARVNRDKASLLLEFFQSVHTRDRGLSFPSLDSIAVPTMGDISFAEDEVKQQLDTLNKNKSEGPDEIHPAILRHLAEILARPLTNLFNKSLNSETLPEDWKMAAVIPIHKGGRKDTAGNYRPVSLTSVVLKVMERLLRDKIGKHLSTHDLISAQQHGFMRNRSCLTNLLSFLDEITSRMDKGEQVEVCYLDFRKAFDSVNHRMLVAKLEYFQLTPKIIRWIEAFLTGRSFYVVVEGTRSTECLVKSGVPQGSVLGPLLFLMYINDLARGLRSPNYMFADDIKVVGNPSTEDLQLDLDFIHKWTVEWDLPLNANKCMRLIANSIEVNPLYIGRNGENLEIPRVTEVRDLGIQVTADFKSSVQCQNATKKARRALYMLTKTITSRDTGILLPLYKSHVRPHLEYCVQAWSPSLNKDKIVLEKVQRTFTRLFPELRPLVYEERLKKLGLFSLGRRRLRGDLIETFKILKNITRAGEHLFSLNRNTVLRGHELKLEKIRASSTARANFFSFRVVNAWNKLPHETVSVNTVLQFKERLDRYWSNLFPELV